MRMFYECALYVLNGRVSRIFVREKCVHSAVHMYIYQEFKMDIFLAACASQLKARKSCNEFEG